MTLEERAEYSALYRKNPAAVSAIYAFFEKFKSRVVSVPGPTNAEYAVFHQRIADEMTERLGRSVSRRQVAEACRRGRNASIALRHAADQLVAKEPDSTKGKALAEWLGETLGKPEKLKE